MRARISLAVSIAALAITTVVAVGTSAANSVPTDSPGATSAFTLPTAAVSAVQVDIATNFALFRSPPSPIPQEIAVAIASSTRYGRNAGLARAIQTPYGKGWVIPGDGWLCIAMPDPVDGYGESCSPTSLAIQRGLWLRLAGDTPDAQAADVLLVPDGVTVKKSAAGTLTAPGTGIVSHLGVVVDAPPTVNVG
jgi:hypothetical protein